MKTKGKGLRIMGWAAALCLPLTVASFLIKTDACSCGPGWGFPFPPYHVVCGSKYGDEFAWTPILFIFNISFWFVAGLPIGLFAEFIRNRKSIKKDAEPAL
jgi:hypothetical protein